MFGVLEGVLSKQEWLVAGKPTVADLSFIQYVPSVMIGERDGAHGEIGGLLSPLQSLRATTTRHSSLRSARESHAFWRLVAVNLGSEVGPKSSTTGPRSRRLLPIVRRRRKGALRVSVASTCIKQFTCNRNLGARTFREDFTAVGSDGLPVFLCLSVCLRQYYPLIDANVLSDISDFLMRRLTQWVEGSDDIHDQATCACESTQDALGLCRLSTLR